MRHDYYQEIEFVSYISPDGLEYPIYGGRRTLMGWSNFGMPPINYLSDRGPFQHGITIRDYRLIERVITLTPLNPGCRRQDRWDSLAELSNIVRLNRGGQGRLLVILPDFTEREIFVRILEGPSNSASRTSDTIIGDMQEQLRFVAEYPVWRNPLINQVVFEVNPVDACLEICLPFCIAGGTINTSISITYPGTWLSYPTITITGPINTPSITNVTTNETILIQKNIASGETVTITLGPQVDSIVNNFGENLIGFVDNPNDLATFHIEVDPIAPGGVNDILVIGSGGDANTGVNFSYYDYYLGVPL